MWPRDYALSPPWLQRAGGSPGLRSRPAPATAVTAGDSDSLRAVPGAEHFPACPCAPDLLPALLFATQRARGRSGEPSFLLLSWQ